MNENNLESLAIEGYKKNESAITVCMLTSVHQAFDVRIYEKESRSLSAAGYRVIIVAPHNQNENSENAEIIAVRRPKSRLQRMTRGIWDVYRKATELNAEVYHFHDPELIPVGVLLKLHGKRVIYDVHEDVPRDILVKNWIAPILRHPVAFGAAVGHYLGARMFDGVIAATPVIATRFPNDKTVTIQNFPWFEEPETMVSPCYAKRGPLVAYVGGISNERGAREMVQAMSRLEGIPEARLILAGEFEKPELEQELKETPGFQRVDYRGWLKREAVDRVFDAVRAGLVLFHPFQSHMESQPNKLFEYMAAGIPVIASDFPLWRNIVGDTGCGLLVDPLDPGDIASAIEWIFLHPREAEEMGMRGASAVRSKYNWTREADKLLRLYRGLTNGHQASCVEN